MVDKAVKIEFMWRVHAKNMAPVFCQVWESCVFDRLHVFVHWGAVQSVESCTNLATLIAQNV